MATPTSSATFDSLRRSIKGGSLAPVYLLHGEEGFFIDRLVQQLEDSMPEADKEFNFYQFYGTDVDAAAVINRCQGYPMMADRQLVIVKEAQGWSASDWDLLAGYAAKPVPTTVLVVSSRGKTVKSKQLSSALTAAHGVDFESKPLKEGAVAPVLESLVKSHGLSIEQKGVEMLCDFIGTDISNLYNQIDKLSIVLEKGGMITPEVIERNIGISKDYNTFELRDAIMNRDLDKAIIIIEYFRSNPKKNPAVPIPATLLGGFVDILLYHFQRDKSPNAVMGALGLKWSSQVARLEKAARAYNARMAIDIISALRDADRKMKGVGSRQDAYDILRDLVFYILNTRGC